VQFLDVRRGIRKLEMADLAEVAVDRVFGDEPLHRVVAVECLAIQGPAGLLAVATDQLPRTPLVAGMDDPAVPGGRAEPQADRLQQRHRRAPAGQFPGRVDAGVAAADDDDVGDVRQLSA